MHSDFSAASLAQYYQLLSIIKPGLMFSGVLNYYNCLLPFVIPPAPGLTQLSLLNALAANGAINKFMLNIMLAWFNAIRIPQVANRVGISSAVKTEGGTLSNAAPQSITSPHV